MIRLALEAENIEARPLWKPMHMQPVFADCEAVGGSVAEDLFQHGLCLPSGTAMTEGDVARVEKIIRRTEAQNTGVRQSEVSSPKKA